METGDRRDWCETLYENRAAGLLLYARSLGLSHAEAEDVLQETFHALLQCDPPPTQPERYALRTLRNRALNHRRSLLRRFRRESRSDHWFDRTAPPTEREEIAMKNLAKLPRKQREVIVLKIWNGHTFEAIGELLGISPNTAAARYRYGLQRLRILLELEEMKHEGHRTETTGGLPLKVDAETPLRRTLRSGFPISPAAGATP